MSRADSIKSEYRQELMEKIANDWLDCADMKTLEEYFLNAQIQYLEDLDDDQLIEHAKDMDIDLTEFLETK
jgi:hypothetical protein